MRQSTIDRFLALSLEVRTDEGPWLPVAKKSRAHLSSALEAARRRREETFARVASNRERREADAHWETAKAMVSKLEAGQVYRLPQHGQELRRARA